MSCNNSEKSNSGEVDVEIKQDEVDNLNLKMIPLPIKLVALSINIANRAGKIIRDVMKAGNLNIVEKGHNDPQTEADRTAQKCIIASLSKQFPKIHIIGEEGDEINDLKNISNDLIETQYDMEFLKKIVCPENLKNIQDTDITVWVDPLDGTNEYTQGYLERVTVLIGIAYKNLPIGGVIHQPYYKNSNDDNDDEQIDIGRTIWGLKGLGVGGTNNYKPIEPLKDEFIVTTTRTHSNREVQTALDALNSTKILRVGGAGYKVLQLLDGIAHAYVFASSGSKKWDTCAPEAVLESYGGKLTDIMGNHYEYHQTVEHLNKFGVLATTKGIDHEAIVNKIPDNVKKILSN